MMVVGGAVVALEDCWTSERDEPIDSEVGQFRRYHRDAGYADELDTIIIAVVEAIAIAVVEAFSEVVDSFPL